MKVIFLALVFLISTPSFANEFCVGTVVEPGYWVNQYYLSCEGEDLGIVDMESNFTKVGKSEFLEKVRQQVGQEQRVSYVARVAEFEVFTSAPEYNNSKSLFCVIRVSSGQSRYGHSLYCKDDVLESVDSTSLKLLTGHLEDENFLKIGEVPSLGPYTAIYSKILIYQKR